ncbi:MAG: hypothetical protein ACT4PM_10825 [Gemmatimonadales bacterium]
MTRLASLLLALGLLAPACKPEPQVEEVTEPLADFSKRVDEYVALRYRVADTLGKIDQGKTQADIAARAAALAQGIVTARPNARQGDIFTPEAATVIATIIQEEYRRRTQAVQETRQEQAEEHEQDRLPPFTPKVNEKFPTNYPLGTFDALLLPLLPKLPEGVLEYRRMDHYLLLRDVEANLIVDFMPQAFPK